MRLRRLLVLTAVAVAVLPAAAASADGSLESLFQDDARILGADPKLRDATLDEARALGAQRVRVTVSWDRIAPTPDTALPPAGFDGFDPGAYPAERWSALDAAVRAIRARGMRVALNPTAPGPAWASSGVFDARLTGVTNPSPAAFGAFVTALGRRYDGTFVPAGANAPLPRIDHWTIWNEPNQGARLAPQWTGTGKDAVPASPQQYRALVGAAWAGLDRTGHRPGHDTILVGDTAPKGADEVTAVSNAMAPIPFLRRLYCVGDDLQLLRGAAATAVGCAASPDPAAFVAQNPALFRMTGWAHHPYELSVAPTTPPERPEDYVTLANLPLLEDQLDRVMARYAVKRTAVPLYLTEYGYQTSPPDALGVSPAKQAAYLNGAEYRAWRDPRVRTLAQTLLVDAGPAGTGASRWGSSFQTGLRYGPGSGRPGVAKPALAAYRLALVVPDRTVGRDRRVRLWAHVRPGTGRRSVDLEVRGARGGYARRRTLRTNADGFLSRTLTVRAGDRGLRLAVREGGRRRISREVSITVPDPVRRPRRGRGRGA